MHYDNPSHLKLGQPANATPVGSIAQGEVRPAGKLQQVQMLLSDLLGREEVLINRLQNLHERLFGPQPSDSINCAKSPSPDGALNELGCALSEALERIIIIGSLVADLESTI